MSLGELLAELNRRELQVWAEGDQLRVRAPKGAVDQALRAALARHKSELLKLLHNGGAGEQHALPLVPVPRDRPAPLSYGQQRLWFLDQLEPDSAAYNLIMPFRVEGRLEPRVFAQCMTEIVRRHEILRTRFREQDGAPVQIVDDEARIDFRVIDQAELAGDAQDFLVGEGQRPFDLAEGPLVRVVMVERGPGQQMVLLCLHHIVADEWARGVLVREIAVLYDAFARGEPSPLPALTLQYADFAHWQRRYLTGDTRRRLVDHWRDRLDGLPPVLELPADRARPQVQTYAGGEVRFDIGAALTAALKARCHAANATPFMGMLGAFFMFLHRLTGRDDLALGTNVINRGRKELAPLIGFFVDNLVMRMDLGDDPTFAAVLERTRAVALDAFAHQDLPFDLLVEELKPARSRAYNPLFQVLFAWVRASDQTADLPAMSGVTITPIEVEATSARFDLTFFVEDHGDRLAARFAFNRDLFERATIEHYAGCFQTLLQALLTAPDRPVATLPLLPAAARDRVLRQWNQTRADYPAERCLHELIANQAGRAPEAPAVITHGTHGTHGTGDTGDTVMTYAALAERSRRLAAYLQELGVGPEVVVGVFLERSPDLIVALLAVLEAGGAFLAMDPAEPPARLRRILEDAQPPVLLSCSALAARLPELGAFVIALDEEQEAILAADSTSVQPGVAPDHLAYLIYTSGSTGAPKGTAICHRSIVNYLWWCAGAYGLRDGTGSPVLGSVSFDGTLTSLFAPLITGRALHLLAPGREIDTLAADAFPARGFSFLKLTPSHLRAFDALGRAGTVLERAHALVLGGEALHGRDLRTWQETGAKTRVFNEYGPTEATVACCVYQVPGDGAPLPEQVPIGRPIANTQLFILDDHQQPVPIGVPGELCIGGAGLARGYLGRPRATAARFIPNPFDEATLGGPTSAHLYRTGDLARYLPDGNIVFLGRLDDQLELRGHRVEPGEIEAALARHPGVEQAAVMLRPVAGSEPRLVAYVVGTEEPGAQLRAFLRDLVPAYMIPAAFVFLDALPLTPSGKVDRRALPAPAATEPATATAADDRNADTASREALALQAIFAELLGLAQVPRRASFFDLGGHSLLAITLIARIRERLGMEVPLGEVFARPTVEGLARWMHEHAQSAEPPAFAGELPACVVALAPAGNKPPLFCAPPSAGSPAIYVGLASHLSADQPVFGFQAPGLAAGEEAGQSIEELASLYIEGMRAIQPRGPYRIAGWSFGAIVACEMARQLEAEGAEVAVLALIDGASLDHGLTRRGRGRWHALLSSSQLVKLLAAMPLPRSYHQFRHMSQWAGVSLPESARDLLRRDGQGRRSYLRRFFSDTRRTLRVFWTSYQAERGYDFAAYGGRAILFRTDTGPRGSDDPMVASVRSFARAGVELRAVPGNHLTLIMDEDNALELAAQLQECLDRAG